MNDKHVPLKPAAQAAITRDTLAAAKREVDAYMAAVQTYQASLACGDNSPSLAPQEQAMQKLEVKVAKVLKDRGLDESTLSHNYVPLKNEIVYGVSHKVGVAAYKATHTHEAEPKPLCIGRKPAAQHTH